MLDNVAIVTGGSSGIGAEFARQLAGRGYNLLLVSNQSEQLATTKAAIEAEYPSVCCLTFFADLATPSAAADIEQFCRDKELTVEVLINNAGIFAFKLMAELPAEKVNLFIDLHMRAVTDLSLRFARIMATRHRGYILNMSSMSCWMPMPGIGMYAATKAYIRVFSRTLALELKESGVGVTVACPGGIATDLFGLPRNLQRLGVKVGALATPERFVRNALKRMFNRKKQYINGFINRLAIVTVSILPDRIRLIVKHKMLDKQ